MNRMEKPRLVDPNPTPRRSNNDPYGFVGTTLADRYQIEDLLGMGGMAAVYRAKHLATTRTVAIKVLKPDLAYTAPQMVEEFLDEAKATANLNHRNIIEVSDADRDEHGTTFLVMQYLKGKPLDDVIDSEQPLPFERIANLFEQICDGVQHAHANGIIHRDLKPGNIMVMADGRGDEVIKILDFGIAKAMTATAKVSREIGTIYYASPEQLSKGSSIDARSDIYSLGVILYQMLTGAVPFNDDSVEHIIYQKLNFAPPLMRQVRAEIPAPVEEVIQRALAKDPANRYQDATEMARAFWRAISLETGALVVDCVDASGRTSLAGASVLINSKYVGQTDVKGHWRQSGMLPRQYLLEIESPRFQHWRASIHVEPREEVTVTVEMQPEPKGDLIIACGVAGAQVELDQKKIGQTDESGRIYVEAVDAGRHHVRLSHPKHLPVEADVEVGITEQAFLQAELKPKNVIWWQRPAIIVSTVVALILVGFLVYKVITGPEENQGGQLTVTSSPSPTLSVDPTQEQPIAPSPEISPTSTLSASPTAMPKSSSTPFPSPTMAKTTPTPTPLPTATATPFPSPTVKRTPPPATPALTPDQVIENYKIMVDRSPNDANANYKLCQAYYSRGLRGDYDDAVRRCGHAIVNNPNHEAAYALIDQAYQRLAEDGNKHALNFYKSRWNTGNRQPLPIYYQGLVYVRTRKKGDAEKHLRMLQEIGSPLASELGIAIAKMR